MKQYTIYCTKEQALRAYMLGAPLEEEKPYAQIVEIGITKGEFGQSVGVYCRIPTAEQMIGWLNTFDLNVSVFGSELRRGFYSCFHYGICVKELLADKKKFVSRKEATLAAIDAALDYLEKKQNK